MITKHALNGPGNRLRNTFSSFSQRLVNIVNGLSAPSVAWLPTAFLGWFLGKFFVVSVWIGLMLSLILLVFVKPGILTPLYQDRNWFRIVVDPLISGFFVFVSSALVGMGFEFYTIVQAPAALMVPFTFAIFGVETIHLGSQGRRPVSKVLDAKFL